MCLSIKRLLDFTIIWIMLGSLIHRYLWPSQLSLLVPDIIVFMLSLANISTLSTNGFRYLTGNALRFCVYAFIFLGIASDIIHLTSPLAMIWGVRMFVRYFLLLLLILKYYSFEDVNYFHILVYKVFYLNTIFCVIQFFMDVKGDAMGGVFTGNGDMALFVLVSLIIFVFDYYNNKISLPHLLALIVISFILAMWAEIKMMYFAIPVAIYAAFVISQSFSIKNLVILLVGILLFVPVLTKTLSLYYDESYIAKTLDYNSLVEYNSNSYGFTEESVNRGTALSITLNEILNDPLDKFIGYGIGSGTASKHFSTSAFNENKRTVYSFFTISYVLIETGLIGLILFCLIYLAFTISFYRVYRVATDESIKYWSGLGLLLGVFSFLFIYYNSSPYSNYYLPFCIWGICYVAINEKLKIQNE